MAQSSAPLFSINLISIKIFFFQVQHLKLNVTIFFPLAAQGAYQSHFRWALIKTLISWFISLKLVIFEKKSMDNNLETLS